MQVLASELRTGDRLYRIGFYPIEVKLMPRKKLVQVVGGGVRVTLPAGESVRIYERGE